MKLNYKNLLRFTGYYLLIVFIVNLVFVLILFPDIKTLFLIFPDMLRSLTVPSLCLIFPVDYLNTSQGFNCPINYGIILLNIYFAALSVILIFTRKLKIFHWVIAFVFLNSLVLIVLALKDYLYSHM